MLMPSLEIPCAKLRLNPAGRKAERSTYEAAVPFLG